MSRLSKKKINLKILSGEVKWDLCENNLDSKRTACKQISNRNSSF